MSETSEPTNDETTSSAKGAGELRDLLRQFTQPVLDSIDHRLRGQIDKRVDDRVDEVLNDRLAVLERAIADLDRSVKELREKLATSE